MKPRKRRQHGRPALILEEKFAVTVPRCNDPGVVCHRRHPPLGSSMLRHLTPASSQSSVRPRRPYLHNSAVVPAHHGRRVAGAWFFVSLYS